MYITISQLKKYMRCPRQLKLHMDGVMPDSKGLSYCRSVVVRTVVAQLNGGLLDDAPDEDILSFCAEQWQQEMADDKVDTQDANAIVIKAKPATKKRKTIAAVTKQEKMLSEIQEWILKYRDYVFGEAKLLYQDVSYEIEIDDFVFTGTIDEIRKVNDDIQTIIYSASSTAPNEEFMIADMEISLIAYALLKGYICPEGNEKTNLGVIPQTHFFHFPYLSTYKKRTGKKQQGEAKGNPLILAERSEEMLTLFVDELLHIAAGIKASYFPKRVVNSCGCNICPFKISCISQEFTGMRKVTEKLSKDEIIPATVLEPSTDTLPNPGEVSIARIKIIQPSSRVEEVDAGKFYNVLTGEVFDALKNIVLLERRNGRVLFSNDDFSEGSRLCWSHDGLFPAKDQIKQKLGVDSKCDMCVNYDFSGKKIVYCPLAAWKQENEKNVPPPCNNTISFLAVDQKLNLLWLSFHGVAIPEARKFMKVIAQQKQQALMYGERLHLRDFKVNIILRREMNAKGKFYVPVFDQSEKITAKGKKYLDWFYRQYVMQRASG